MKNSARLMKSDEFNAVPDRPHCSKPVSAEICKILPGLPNEQSSNEMVQIPFLPVHNEISVDEAMEALTRKLLLVVISLSLVVFLLFSLAPAV
jgi:hypothetical protein